MKIRILTVGKVQDDWLRKGIAHYARLLRSYAELEIFEVADSPDTLPPERALRLEGERLLTKIASHDFVVALDLAGQAMDSETFASELNRWFTRGGAKLTFVIAGSNGYAPEVLTRADERVSFGAITFPHQIARLLLLEQLFRAFKIQRGERYHK